MEEGTTYVGMDVHKRTIAVSVRFPGWGFDERTIPHEAMPSPKRFDDVHRGLAAPFLVRRSTCTPFSPNDYEENSCERPHEKRQHRSQNPLPGSIHTARRGLDRPWNARSKKIGN